MERDEWSTSEVGTLLSVSQYSGVTIRRMRDGSHEPDTRAESLVGYKIANAQDLVVNIMLAWNGSLGVAPCDGIVSPAYCVYRFRSGDPWFFHNLLRSPQYRAEIKRRSRGVVESRLRLYSDDLFRVPLLEPPADEQSAIVRFINHMDRRIRRYVFAKRTLIALLNEQKRAIIHRIVTRGLDATNPLKPSGVAWLGDVPEHWTVSRVKNEFFCLNKRRVPLSATERGAMTLRRYDYYGASGVIDKVIDCLFDDDLLLIAEDGANLVLRNLPLAIIARGKFWVNNHAHVLKPRRGNLEFLSNLMESLSYIPWISGAAQPKLTQDRLMNIAIAVPPPNEQDEIVRRIYNETSSLEVAIDHSRREIDLLREYRTCVIASVVTGKLDVRSIAAALPDERDELDLSDDSSTADDDTTDEVSAEADAEEIQL